MLGSTIEALGGGSDVSDAAGVAGGMLNGAQSMSGLGRFRHGRQGPAWRGPVRRGPVRSGMVG